jgi:hypothetical protein
MERCRAARDFVRRGKDGRRVTGWVWIPGRSEERRWRSSLAESPLARQLLRIPMSRFPVFKWRQWLAGSTSSREQGPTVGWMSLMVWDNAGARRARPIEEALSGLGQACKGELVGGVAGLKVKVRSSWLRLQDLCPLPRVHPQNWLRTPPAGHGPLTWRGAVDQRTWQDCLRGCRTDKRSRVDGADCWGKFCIGSGKSMRVSWPAGRRRRDWIGKGRGDEAVYGAEEARRRVLSSLLHV